MAPQSVWDAILAGSGELLMRRPGIVSLHSLTTDNAMRYAFETSGRRRDPALASATSRGVRAAVPRRNRDPQGEPRRRSRSTRWNRSTPKATGAEAVEEIFADLSKNKATAARKVLGYLKANPDPRPLTDAARRLIFRKGTDSHDYKFSSAVLEDYAHVSPEWRDRFLAASVFWLKGSGDRDSSLVQRMQAALKG